MCGTRKEHSTYKQNVERLLDPLSRHVDITFKLEEERFATMQLQLVYIFTTWIVQMKAGHGDDVLPTTRGTPFYPFFEVNFCNMLPEFDYAIVDCVHEMIFNRTFLGQVDHPLDSDYYRNMVNKRHK
ncbi:hypothetical protein COOONC_19609 [Cooperia oncophora]